VRLWRAAGEAGQLPDDVALSEARAGVGAEHVIVDEDALTVALDKPGVALDLGAAGKGYALDLAIGVLREHGVTSALLHGGTSSVQAVGESPEGGPWRVAIEQPYANAVRAGERVLTIVELRDQALGVSAGHGKQFRAGDAWYGHVLDPRAGRPARAAQLAAVVCDSGTDADALSTGLLVLGAAGGPRLPRARTLVVEGDVSAPPRVHARGFTLPHTLQPQHV
jgi:thiamine biosynthesis lipoprotein